MSIIIDKEAIQRIKSLESPDMPDVLKQIVEIFTEATPADINSMKTSSAAQCAKLAHKLKSSCSSLGITEMTAICYHIETSATQMPQADLLKQIDELEKLFALAKVELQKMV